MIITQDFRRKSAILKYFKSVRSHLTYTQKFDSVKNVTLNTLKRLQQIVAYGFIASDWGHPDVIPELSSCSHSQEQAVCVADRFPLSLKNFTIPECFPPAEGGTACVSIPKTLPFLSLEERYMAHTYEEQLNRYRFEFLRQLYSDCISPVQ